MDDPLPVGLKEAWEEFFKENPVTPYPPVPHAAHISRVDHRAYDHPMLFPLQRKREAEQMLDIAAATSPAVVMEIGADKCGSLYHWCLLPSVTTVIACEVRGTPAWRPFNLAFLNTDFLWLAENSHSRETVDKVRRWLGKQQIDVLFLDGDKSGFAVDYEYYLPMMSPTGVIFFHDIQDSPGPRDAWHRCRINHAYSEVLDVSESVEACEREKEGIPVATAHEGWLRHWKGRSCGVGVLHLGR